MSHYAPKDDIATIELAGLDGRRALGESYDWGLILRDRDTRRTIGFEIWQASERLPAEMLAALPRLEGDELIVDSDGSQSHAA